MRESFDRISPIWKFIDPNECNRLEESRKAIGQTSTVSELAERVRSTWHAADLLSEKDPYNLGMTVVTPRIYIPFVRFVEQLILEAKPPAILVYWSRHSAARLLPVGPTYRKLMRDAFCISIFSEEHEDPPDEWCIWTESRDLCLIFYGQEVSNQDER